MKLKKIIGILLAAILCMPFLAGCGKIDPTNISKEEYEQIYIGMNKDKVDKIVGGGGEQFKEDELKSGTPVYVYKYKGERKGSATLSFIIVNTGGFSGYFKLIEKTEDNLK